MEYADYVSRISFRFLKPYTPLPKIVKYALRNLVRFTPFFEIANMSLPDDEQYARSTLYELCKIPKLSTFAIGAESQRDAGGLGCA